MRTFKESLELGKATEKAVILIPKLRVYARTPLTDIANGGAPHLIGPDGAAFATVVLPDYELDRPGEHFGAEIKGKDHADYTRITGEPEHGIACRLIENYLLWQQQKERELIIFVDEQRTGEVLAARLSTLMNGTREVDVWMDRRDGRSYRRPRVSAMHERGRAVEHFFFGRKQFKVFHQGEAKDVPLLKGVTLAPTMPVANSLSDV
jgi:hypothetical protein